MSIIGHLNEQKLVLVMTRYLISKPELDLETRQINPKLQSSNQFSSSPPNMIDFLFWQVRFDEKINNNSRKIFLFYLQRNLNFEVKVGSE